MPSSLRISEEQINHLASMARHEHSKSGRVFLKNHENTGKWLPRWCALYQNFLFYFESEDSVKPLGAIYLEHSSCERLCLTNLKDSENQVWPYSLCSIFPSLILKDFVLLIILLFSTQERSSFYLSSRGIFSCRSIGAEFFFQYLISNEKSKE